MTDDPLAPQATYTFKPGDRLFPTVRDLLIFLAAFAETTYFRVHRKPISEDKRGPPAMAFLADHVAMAFHLPLHEAIDCVMDNREPNEIEIQLLDFDQRPKLMPTPKAETYGLQ